MIRAAAVLFLLFATACSSMRYDFDAVPFPVRADEGPQGGETFELKSKYVMYVHGLLGELRRRKKEDPGTVVAVVGCMADREGEELFAREPHVDIVCGSRHFPRLPDMVDRVLGGEERVIELAVKGMLPKNALGRVLRKKLKVYAGAEHPHHGQKPQPLDI